MKRGFFPMILAAGVLLAAPATRAQDVPDALRVPAAPEAATAKPCGMWDLWSLRGTYAFSASGWQDLSEINPALPKLYAPVTIIGSFKVNGNGEVSGWSQVNAGGIPMTAEFVNSQFGAPKADCGFPITLSMKIKEYGGVISGPYAYGGVIAGDMSALELHFMMLGIGPGAHVDSHHAKRISMSFK